jgi:hypothetical protein
LAVAASVVVGSSANSSGNKSKKEAKREKRAAEKGEIFKGPLATTS